MSPSVDVPQFYSDSNDEEREAQAPVQIHGRINPKPHLLKPFFSPDLTGLLLEVRCGNSS
jgi:hypothetical protein